MAMQYAGWVTINSVSVPVTSCSLDKTVSPIIPPLIWGGGYPINYSKGKQSYGGEIRFPLFSSFTSTLTSLVNVGSSNRDTFRSIVFDNGVESFTYANSKIASCTLSGSASGGSVIEVALSVVSKGRTGPSAHAAGSGFTATTTSTALQTPVPYFNSAFTAFGIASNQIIDWSITVSNNPFILYTHDGTADPNDIQLGLQTVEGSFSYYATTTSGFGFQTGSISTNETNAIVDTDVSAGSLTVNSSTLWTFGYGVLMSAPRTIDNPSNKPIRQVRFQLLGNTTTAPIS